MRNRLRTLAIFTLVIHKEKDGKLYGYSPYVNEINMWTSHFDKVLIVGCFDNSKDVDKLETQYLHPNVKLTKIPVFNIKSLSGILKLILNLPFIIFKMALVMHRSHHLHFRCPSNVSAIASVVQVFFSK